MAEKTEHRTLKRWAAKQIRGTTEFHCPHDADVQRPDFCPPPPTSIRGYVDCSRKRVDGSRSCGIEVVSGNKVLLADRIEYVRAKKSGRVEGDAASLTRVGRNLRALGRRLRTRSK